MPLSIRYGEFIALNSQYASEFDIPAGFQHVVPMMIEDQVSLHVVDLHLGRDSFQDNATQVFGIAHRDTYLDVHARYIEYGCPLKSFLN
jgi:hypothetical protein